MAKKESSTQEDFQTLYTAFNLYTNWDKMSKAQKSKALVALGMTGYKFTTGESLAKKFLIEPSATSDGLTFGQAFSLFATGINVYSLAKNWEQLNTLQKLSGGTSTALNVASTAKAFNLLGFGTKGAAVPAASIAQLGTAWGAAPSFGVGAVTAPVGTVIPSGYTAVASGGEGVIAIPTANMSTAGGAASGGMPIAAWGTPSYAGVAGAVFEGATTISNISKVPEDDRATYAQKHAALAAANIFTAGGASAAYGLLMNTSIGKKLDKAYNKLDKAINPVTRIANRFTTDAWKTEGNRLAKLREQGVYVPDEMFAELPTRGRSKEELIAEAEATGGNVKFAGSRKESDLTPEDIVNYSVWAESDPEWYRRPMEERLARAGEALEAGAVREHHGTIDVDFSKLQAPGASESTPTEPENPETDPVEQKTLNGSRGGSQMQAGLAQMAKNDPYLMGAAIAHSAYMNAFKEDGGDSKTALDSLRDTGEWSVAPSKDGSSWTVTLPDGQNVDLVTLPGKLNVDNDLEYFAGLAGITLGELSAKGKHSYISKLGQSLANASLTGTLDKEFTPENFAKVRDNYRALYSQAGISSRADAYKLANTMYAGERLDDIDLVRAHQVADMVFTDGGYQIAQQLMPGKNRGIMVAKEDAKRFIPKFVDPSSSMQSTGPEAEDPNPVGQRPIETGALQQGGTKPLRSKEDVVSKNQEKYRFFGAAAG